MTQFFIFRLTFTLISINRNTEIAGDSKQLTMDGSQLRSSFHRANDV